MTIEIKESRKLKNANVVADESGRQYHIDLAPGELAEYIILVGSAKRAEIGSKMLTNIRATRHNREYLTYTGQYKDKEISIMSTGMGPGCIEIGLIEIFQITQNPALVRVGTSGSLQKDINIGDLVISTGAVRLEDTSTYFVHEGYPAVANYEVLLALMMAAENQKAKYHLGLTAAASGFYGAQGRHVPGIYIRNPNLADELSKMNVANFEMESSTIFNLAQMKGCRASTVCLALANRPKNEFMDLANKEAGEIKSLEVGFEALHILQKMDAEKAKRGKEYWLPTL